MTMFKDLSEDVRQKIIKDLKIDTANLTDGIDKVVNNKLEQLSYALNIYLSYNINCDNVEKIISNVINVGYFDQIWHYEEGKNIDKGFLGLCISIVLKDESDELSKIRSILADYLQNIGIITKIDNTYKIKDISNKYLHITNLENTNLEKANLTHAHMRQVKLNKANLKNADLTSANIEDSDFSDADLTGAIFSNAKLDHVNFTGANLSFTDLSECILTDITFDNCNLTNCIFINENQILDTNLLINRLNALNRLVNSISDINTRENLRIAIFININIILSQKKYQDGLRNGERIFNALLSHAIFNNATKQETGRDQKNSTVSKIKLQLKDLIGTTPCLQQNNIDAISNSDAHWEQKIKYDRVLSINLENSEETSETFSQFLFAKNTKSVENKKIKHAYMTFDAYQQIDTSFYSNDSNDNETVKIDILCHGSPGADCLATTNNPGDKNRKSIHYNELAAKLKMIIGNKKAVINLISCSAGKGTSDYNRNSYFESFASKLHDALNNNRANQEIPVVARTASIKTNASGMKSTRSLSHDYTIDPVGRDASSYRKQPGSKILFTRDKDNNKVIIDLSLIDWKKSLLKTLHKISKQTALDEKKTFISNWISKFNDLSAEDIYKTIQTELKNPKSVLKNHSNTLSFLFSSNTNSVNKLSNLMNRYKYIKASPHSFDAPIRRKGSP